jgi:hypothetical protein
MPVTDATLTNVAYAEATWLSAPYHPHSSRSTLHVAMYTYDLLFYLHADERRETDCYWRTGYSIPSLPLIRNLIDATKA